MKAGVSTENSNLKPKTYLKPEVGETADRDKRWDLLFWMALGNRLKSRENTW